jgi:hypothetical protein
MYNLAGIMSTSRVNKLYPPRDYERTLYLIYESKATFISVFYFNETVCVNERWERALLAVVRHHHRTNHERTDT